MKTITLFLCSLFVTVAMVAQGQFFVHTATPASISADASFIDHPDLNGNPAAKILISHNWNPPGSTGVYNDNNTGVFYSNSQNQWGVYNESGAAMVPDSSYNVYIGDGPHVYEHIADLANQAPNDVYSVLNHPDLNNNPDAKVVLTTYYNPNGLRNDHPYAVWYDGGTNRWNIFGEDLGTLPLDTAFFVGIEGGDVGYVTHTATAGNISSNWTSIDHPLLNGNPDAVFVFTHNWGTTGDPANVVIDHKMGVWYTGSNWAIYTEDSSAMPVGAEFDLMVYDPSLGVGDSSIEGLSFSPNPTTDLVTISANTEISSVTLFNILGQELAQIDGKGVSVQIDLSTYKTGYYLARVESENATQTIKLVRQ